MSRFEIIEDKSGRLHLAYMDEKDNVVYFNSDYASENLMKVVENMWRGGNPTIDNGWKENSSAPQTAYDALKITGLSYTVANNDAIYPGRMRAAARCAFSFTTRGEKVDFNKTLKDIYRIEARLRILGLTTDCDFKRTDWGVYMTTEHFALIEDFSGWTPMQSFWGKTDDVLRFLDKIIDSKIPSERPPFVLDNDWIYTRLDDELNDEKSGLEKTYEVFDEEIEEIRGFVLKGVWTESTELLDSIYGGSIEGSEDGDFWNGGMRDTVEKTRKRKVESEFEQPTTQSKNSGGTETVEVDIEGVEALRDMLWPAWQLGEIFEDEEEYFHLSEQINNFIANHNNFGDEDMGWEKGTPYEYYFNIPRKIWEYTRELAIELGYDPPESEKGQKPSLQRKNDESEKRPRETTPLPWNKEEKPRDEEPDYPEFSIEGWEKLGIKEGLKAPDVSRHFLVLGETGSGKTESGVKPLLRAILRFRESLPNKAAAALVIDPKSELKVFIESELLMMMLKEHKTIGYYNSIMNEVMKTEMSIKTLTDYVEQGNKNEILKLYIEIIINKEIIEIIEKHGQKLEREVLKRFVEETTKMEIIKEIENWVAVEERAKCVENFITTIMSKSYIERGIHKEIIRRFAEKIIDRELLKMYVDKNTERERPKLKEFFERSLKRKITYLNLDKHEHHLNVFEGEIIIDPSTNKYSSRRIMEIALQLSESYSSEAGEGKGSGFRDSYWYLTPRSIIEGILDVVLDCDQIGIDFWSEFAETAKTLDDGIDVKGLNFNILENGLDKLEELEETLERPPTVGEFAGWFLGRPATKEELDGHFDCNDLPLMDTHGNQLPEADPQVLKRKKENQFAKIMQERNDLEKKLKHTPTVHELKVFPEGYYKSSDNPRIELVKDLNILKRDSRNYFKPMREFLERAGTYKRDCWETFKETCKRHKVSASIANKMLAMIGTDNTYPL